MSFVIGTTFEIRRRLLWDKVTRVFRDIDRLIKLSVYLFTELFISNTNFDIQAPIMDEPIILQYCITFLNYRILLYDSSLSNWKEYGGRKWHR